MRVDEQVSYNGTRVLATPAKIELFQPVIKNDIETLYSYLQHWYNVVQTIDKKLSSIEKKENI